MMTDKLREFSHARRRLRAAHVDPIENLIATANEAIAEAQGEARKAHEVLEQMRPVWAQGWTDEGVAASVSANAIAELWWLLGVTNQTAAVERLRALLEEKGADA